MTNNRSSYFFLHLAVIEPQRMTTGDTIKRSLKTNLSYDDRAARENL